MRRVLAPLLLLLSSLSSIAAESDCSAYRGDVALNEYYWANTNDSGEVPNYIELKVIDADVLATTTNLQGWTVAVTVKQGNTTKTTTKNAAFASNSCPNATYVRIEFGNNELENEAVVLLRDGSGKEVDVFKVRQSSQSLPSASILCPALAAEPVLVVTSSGARDYARVPDGTGSWAVSSGSGANSEDTYCGSNDGGAVASGFNAVEAGTLTADASVASGRLYTKLVASAFTFDVVALNAGNQRETNFGAKSVQVELVDASTGSCATYASLSPAQSQTLGFAETDQGRKSVAPVTLSRAYRKLAVRMTGDGITRCSSDLFSVRPPSFTVSSSDANADATGSSTTVTPKIAAGAAFSLQAAAGAGYDGTPLLNTTSSRWQAHGATAVHAVPTGSFGTAAVATGIAVGTDFAYHDVGYFRLAEAGAVEDTTFTAIDQSGDCTDDYSNAMVSGKYGCKIGNAAPSDYFGRFVPHHFAVVPAAILTHRADIAACSASLFTYLGEPLKLVFALQAQHAANGVTRKYEGSFGKLNLSVPANLGFAAVAGSTVLSGVLDFACTGCGTLAAATAATADDWVEGVADVSATLAVKRPTAPPLPYYAAAAAVTFGIRPDDGDIDHALAVYDADMDAAVTGNDRLLLKNASGALAADYLFGRMRLGTAYGSELLKLVVPVEAQVWNGSAFVAAADSCTPLLAGNVALDSTLTAVDSIGALAGGKGSITLKKPMPAQRVTARICVDLGSNHLGADDGNCTAGSPASLRYLAGPWDGTSGFYDRDPSARAAFGLNRAPYIYYRTR